MRPAPANRAAQARRFAAFARDYNEERPHQALGQLTPASVYRPSPRPMPQRLPEPHYPVEAAVRRVRSNGEIKWRGDLIHISSALACEAVAVEETEAGEWQVRSSTCPSASSMKATKGCVGLPSPSSGTASRRKSPNHE